MTGNSLENRSPLAWLFSVEVALLFAIAAVVLVAAALDTNRGYFSPKDLQDILPIIARNTALLGIFALGASVVIISGGIDLSAGSTIAFSGSICACVMFALAPKEMLSQQAVGPGIVVLAMGCSLICGLMVGTLHAWLITAVRLPPFVATLATLVGLRSFSRALVEYVTMTFGSGKMSRINISDPIFKYIRKQLDWEAPVLVFLLIALFTWILLTRTVLGRHLYALGGNEQAARLSGIRTDLVKWFAYCFAAVTASIAGLLYIANESVANPVDQGRGHELNAIAAAVVGGCSLQGGIGTVPGVMLGALFLQVVIDAVGRVIKTGADVYEGLIVGIVVVIAVTFSQLRQLFTSGRQLFGGPIGWFVLPVLLLFLSMTVLMTGGAAASGTVAVVALVVLVAWKIIESRKAV